MPKLIFRSNYFCNESAYHRSNYIKYLGTRDGVEMNPELLPRFFYEDDDMHGKKENYIDYIANRPRVERIAEHGLFSYEGAAIDLQGVMDEVAEHKGNVWINVISLQREDAVRLGYDNVEHWQNLLRSHIAELSENFKITPQNLQWYAAFHNESYHPHVHLVVYSTDIKEGHLTKKGIENLKSVLLNDIFKCELTSLYDEKTAQRKNVKEQARESLLLALDKLSEGNYQSQVIEQQMFQLAQQLKKVNGKKFYGYLSKNTKQKVDAIVDELVKFPELKECYEKWWEYQKKIHGYYHDDVPVLDPLSKCQEFKSIKNMIIKEAVKLGDVMPEKIIVPGRSEEEKDMVSLTEPVNDASPDTNTKNMTNSLELPLMTSRLMNHLENIFENLIRDTQGGSKIISERKQKRREKQKQVALGQRMDDEESEENLNYLSQKYFV